MNRHVLRRACWATLLCLSVSIVPKLLAQQIARKTTQAERPNIILMLCDNHGYGVAKGELFDLETEFAGRKQSVREASGNRRTSTRAGR